MFSRMKVNQNHKGAVEIVDRTVSRGRMKRVMRGMERNREETKTPVHKLMEMLKLPLKPKSSSCGLWRYLILYVKFEFFTGYLF